jgi:hypothetical protein
MLSPSIMPPNGAGFDDSGRTRLTVILALGERGRCSASDSVHREALRTSSLRTATWIVISPISGANQSRNPWPVEEFSANGWWHIAPLILRTTSTTRNNFNALQSLCQESALVQTCLRQEMMRNANGSTRT